MYLDPLYLFLFEDGSYSILGERGSSFDLCFEEIGLFLLSSFYFRLETDREADTERDPDNDLDLDLDR